VAHGAEVIGIRASWSFFVVSETLIAERGAQHEQVEDLASVAPEGR
jgi:hypothetical protein